MNYEQLTAHYLERAKEMLDEAFGDDRARWMQWAEAELPQIRRVLAWLRKEGDVTRGLTLTYLLQELWFEEQHTEEGLSLIQAFLAVEGAGEDPSLQAQSLDLAGAFALSLGRFERARSQPRSRGDYASAHAGQPGSAGLRITSSGSSARLRAGRLPGSGLSLPGSAGCVH